MAFCNFKTYNGRENERNVICFLSMENTVPQFLVQTAMHGSWFLNNRKWSGNYKGGGAVLVKHIKVNDTSAGFYSSKSSSLNSGCWPIFQISVVVNESQKNINRDNVSVVSQCFLPPPLSVAWSSFVVFAAVPASTSIYIWCVLNHFWTSKLDPALATHTKPITRMSSPFVFGLFMERWQLQLFWMLSTSILFCEGWK